MKAFARRTNLRREHAARAIHKPVFPHFHRLPVCARKGRTARKYAAHRDYPVRAGKIFTNPARNRRVRLRGHVENTRQFWQSHQQYIGNAPLFERACPAARRKRLWVLFLTGSD